MDSHPIAEVVAGHVLLQPGDDGGDDLEGVGDRGRIRSQHCHREYPGVGADVEEDVSVLRQFDHKVECEGVLRLVRRPLPQ